MATADEFAQLALLFTDPLQREYEVIRPVVLFAETVAERSRQTGLVRFQYTSCSLQIRSPPEPQDRRVFTLLAPHTSHKGPETYSYSPPGEEWQSLCTET